VWSTDRRNLRLSVPTGARHDRPDHHLVLGQSTAAEVIEGIDLTGRRVVVTGGASGIGVETTRGPRRRPAAEVTLAVRDVGAGVRVAADLTAGHRQQADLVAPLDLADQASVAAFVAGWDGPLDILVNNAGVMASPLARTPEGWEMQFATNHLGHFALAIGCTTRWPRPAGPGSCRSAPARTTGPGGLRRHPLRAPPVRPFSAYGQSKTANVLFAVEASKRWGHRRITVNALMPGGIRTNLQRYVPDEVLEQMRTAAGGGGLKWKTPEQGAATSVLVATAPLLDGVGGRYFEDCKRAGGRRAHRS